MKFIAGYDFLSGLFASFAIFRGGKTGLLFEKRGKNRKNQLK